MPDLPETLRQRVERTYRYEVMSLPLALRLAQPEAVAEMGSISPEERLQIAWKMSEGLRTALFDLAEQLDVLLGGQVKPD